MQGEERQGFWANDLVFPGTQMTTAEFPAGTPLGQVHTALTERWGISMIHLAAGTCSLRAAHVLLSAGADETAVGRTGSRAIDIVGTFQVDDERNTANEGALCRILRRGPAFRARSWTWTAETDHFDVGRAPGMARSAVSSVQRAPIVRVFRAGVRGPLVGLYARYGSACSII